MSLQLSNATKNKGLNDLFRPSTLYAMVPTAAGSPTAELRSAVINFSVANNGQIGLAAPVQLSVQTGVTINVVYLHTSILTNATVDDALVRIDLTGDDVETYDNNGIYIINTINVAINT